MDANDVPIYERPFGFGFILVVEAQRATSADRSHPGEHVQPDGMPDLQIQSDARSRQRQHGGVRRRRRPTSAACRASTRRGSRIPTRSPTR